MEGRVDVVGPGPGLMHGRVGADHVVVGQDVGEAKLLGPLAVRADGTPIGSDLSLRKHHADIHDCWSTTSARPCSARPYRPGSCVTSPGAPDMAVPPRTRATALTSESWYCGLSTSSWRGTR